MRSASDRHRRTGRARVGATAAAAALALCAAGCGNYSNDDLAFLAAVPDREQLQVVVPASSAQPACALGEATAATGARSTGSGINQLVDGILALVDLIRAVPPTVREGDRRGWGPWPDDKHPGVRYQVSMARRRGAVPADDTYDYAFTGSLSGGPWLTVIAGQFVGAQAKNGTGGLTLFFDASWQLGTNDPTTPHGSVQIGYTLAGDPRTVEAQLATTDSGFGLQPAFAYRYAGYADRRAVFDFAFTDASGNFFTVDARFTAAGDGEATLSARTPAGQTASISECFDGTACIGWLLDPLALTPACGGVRPCTLGNASACPAGLP